MTKPSVKVSQDKLVKLNQEKATTYVLHLLYFLTVLILIFFSPKVNQASHIEDLKSSSIENYVRIISA